MRDLISLFLSFPESLDGDTNALCIDGLRDVHGKDAVLELCLHLRAVNAARKPDGAREG